MSDRVMLNENLVLTVDDEQRRVTCAHWCHPLAEGDRDYRDDLSVHEGPSTEAGPQIWPNWSDYIDTPVVLREGYRPGCFVVVVTEVVPENHPRLADEWHRAGKAPEPSS
jgi:N-methylhydantoinase B